MGQSDPLHALKIASKSSKKTQKKKKKKTKDKNKNKNKKKVGIMIIENKRRQKNFLRKKHLRELRKLRVKERIGEQKDQIGFQMKQQEEALALEPDSITLMTFLSLSLSLSDSLLFFLFQLLFFNFFFGFCKRLWKSLNTTRATAQSDER